MRASSLEAVELLNVHHEHNGTADGHLDRTGNEGTWRRGFEGHHVDELFAALAVLADESLEGRQLRFLGSDEDGGVAFPKEATGGTDNRELESGLDEFVGYPASIPVVNDADGEFQPA